MANILVTYYSLTGNTKIIAEAIYETLPPQKEILPLQEVKDINPYDLLFIGFPVHTHSVPYAVELFLRSLPPAKKIALFSTHGSHTGSHLSREALEHVLTLLPQVNLLGTFTCRGKVSLQAQEVFQKLPEHQAWATMAVSSQNHPNQHDQEEAKSFAQWVLALYHSQK